MGLSDDDDRGEGPSTSQAAAGFGPDDDPQLDLALDNDEPLDMHGIDSRIWLVKVPKFLLERWQNVREEGKELGRLRVYKKPLPNGDERIAVLLPPARTDEAEIPTEYAMSIQNKQTKNTLIFAEKDDVTHGEAGWEPGRGRVKPHESGDAAKRPAKKRVPTVTGVVNHECNLTPRVDSASYRKIMRQRQAKAAEPKRTIQRLDDDRTEQSRLGLAGMTGRKFDFVMKTTNKPKADTTNRFLARVPRNEILDMLFSAFEQYDYWSLKNLRSHTQQPETYLKEVLADIAQLNRRGPYAGMWSLQEGFRRQIKAESSGTAAKTEDPDGEDVKPNIEGLDDDDDDVDMDSVL